MHSKHPWNADYNIVVCTMVKVDIIKYMPFCSYLGLEKEAVWVCILKSRPTNCCHDLTARLTHLCGPQTHRWSPSAGWPCHTAGTPRPRKTHPGFLWQSCWWGAKQGSVPLRWSERINWEEILFWRIGKKNKSKVMAAKNPKQFKL